MCQRPETLLRRLSLGAKRAASKAIEFGTEERFIAVIITVLTSKKWECKTHVNQC